MKRVLFVCLGNICRSPTAEGVFRKLVEDAGLRDRFHIDSAGTGGWHVGDPPDRRMRAAAKKRGYQLDSVARQVEPDDFDKFDHIVAMDRSNYEDLFAICPKEHQHKIVLLRDWDEERGDVPDPYYGAAHGFDLVIDIVERSCKKLLDHLR